MLMLKSGWYRNNNYKQEERIRVTLLDIITNY